jgi:hypothetical protein
VRLFTCDNCNGVLFFENSHCMSCDQPIGYCAEAAKLVSLPKEQGENVRVEVALAGGKHEAFLKCKNFTEHDTCNWLVRAEDNQPYCLSCRLTGVIPDVSDPKNKQAWAEVESAKRRLLYTLRALRLPVFTKAEDAVAGLSFQFLIGSDDAPVMTGHADGLITLNVAEADAAYRENMREKLGEAYRTVLGHLRHEIGHYYWDRLIRDGNRLEACRALFGDDSVSYESAIQRHYGEGPPADWAASYISAYATMHPWEDWAETWAHYLHMLDTLETAKSHGLTVRVPGELERVSTDELTFGDFEGLMASWQAVTIALNSLSRSMGMKDVYPFVLSKLVRDKLHFVHQVVTECAGKPLPHVAPPATIASAGVGAVPPNAAPPPPLVAPASPAAPPASALPPQSPVAAQPGNAGPSPAAPVAAKAMPAVASSRQ